MVLRQKLVTAFCSMFSGEAKKRGDIPSYCIVFNVDKMNF